MLKLCRTKEPVVLNNDDVGMNFEDMESCKISGLSSDLENMGTTGYQAVQPNVPALPPLAPLPKAEPQIATADFWNCSFRASSRRRIQDLIDAQNEKW